MNDINVWNVFLIFYLFGILLCFLFSRCFLSFVVILWITFAFKNYILFCPHLNIMWNLLFMVFYIFVFVCFVFCPMRIFFFELLFFWFFLTVFASRYFLRIYFNCVWKIRFLFVRGIIVWNFSFFVLLIFVVLFVTFCFYLFLYYCYDLFSICIGSL